jgi:hypothetical protein
MEMDMNNSIYIDINAYNAEDNVTLTYLRSNKKKISSINILKSTIELQLQDESYTSPASKEYTKNRSIIIIKKVINKLIRLSTGIFNKLSKTKKFNKLFIIHRNDIENYRDLINSINQITDKPTEVIIFTDWLPNVLERFILSKFNLKCFNRPLRGLSSLPINLSEEIVFLANNLDLKVKSSWKIDGEIRFNEYGKNDIKKFVEFRTKQNTEIEIVINSEFPLELTIKPMGFQDRESWHPKLFGQLINNNVKNAFLLNNHGDVSIDQMEEIIKYGLNLISISDLNNVESLMRLDLPGLLIPFDPLKFDFLVHQAKLNRKCFRIRSNGTSFVYLHLCKIDSCEPDLVSNTNFYHFQGFNPRHFATSSLSKNLGTKKICMVLPPYTRASGGIVALYKLHDYLKENGFEVYVLPYHPTGLFPFYKRMNILFQEKVNFDLKEAIWIYSDTVSSLPVDAHVQIQWLMNRQGNLPATSTGSFRIKPSYVYKYSDVISEDITNKLFISNFNFELFYPRSYRNRIGPTIYLGKSSGIDIFDFNSLFQKDYQIINRSFPLNEDLPDFLSASKILISFDTLSALNIEANLCGTPTLIVTNPKSKFKEQDIRRFELPTSGIVYNLDELDKVPKLDLSFHEYFKSEAIKLEQSSLAKFLNFLEKL